MQYTIHRSGITGRYYAVIIYPDNRCSALGFNYGWPTEDDATAAAIEYCASGSVMQKGR